MANKMNLWICDFGLSACFHVTLLYYFFKSVSCFLKGL